MEQIVTGCKDCGLYVSDGNYCNHPKRSDFSEYYECLDAIEANTVLEYCPLKSEPITIKLNTNNYKLLT